MTSGPRDGGFFLDMGPGDGAALSATVEGTRARGVALDPRVDGEWRGPEGFERVQGNGARLPFEDGAFSAAFCLDTIEWLPNPGAVISEMARVSRERVVLVQSVWTSLWFDSGDLGWLRQWGQLFGGESLRP